jgi:hypothetical protein
MANRSVTITVKHAIPNGGYSLGHGSVADPNGTAPDYTTVAANIATLVADGASPTQAHVTTLNTNWGTYKTAADAYTAKVGSVSADVTFFYNPANITNMNQARAALREIERQLMGRLMA